MMEHICDMWALPSDHPYVKQFTATIKGPTEAGAYIVAWRDFATVKQDREFDTEAEAHKFADKLVRGPHIVRDDTFGGMSYEDLTNYWDTL